MGSDLTPVEEHAGVWVKRDDLFEPFGRGVRGGKVRACLQLSEGAIGLVTASSRVSPQAECVARVAELRGIPARIHVPQGPETRELAAAVAAGAEIVMWRPGHNSVIVARARQDAATRGWALVPFGMECAEAVAATRRQTANLPSCTRVVVPVGSGMSLAGILWGLLDREMYVPVLGIRVGADPSRRLDRWAPPVWWAWVRMVEPAAGYHHPVDASLGGLALDPYYEAKCVPYLRPGDLFWVVGRRGE